MRTLIVLAVLSIAGTGWWMVQPDAESGLEAALARVSAGSPDGTAATSHSIAGAPVGSGAGSQAEPSIEDDVASLQHYADIVDRKALEALEQRFARALIEDPDNGALHLALCTSTRLLGDPVAAVAFGDRAGALLPESSAAQLEHAKALAGLMSAKGVFAAMKHLGAYKKLILRAIELDPDNVKARVEHIGFLVFAPGLVGGDLDEAKRLAEELAPLDARYGALMQVLALGRAEQISQALALCEETLLDHPGDQALNLTLARMLQEEGRGGEAAAHFDAVLSGPRTEKYYQALYHRAVLRIESDEDLDLALSAIQEYGAADPYGDFLPSLAAAHWRQGQVYELMDRPGRARACYEASLTEDPDFEQAEDALAELD